MRFKLGLIDEENVKMGLDNATRFMSNYAETFNEGNTQRLVDHFYDTPLSLIQNDRTVVMKTNGEVFEGIESMIVTLGVRDGTVTNIQDLSFCVISDDLTFVKTDFKRDFASGESIEMTYIYVLRQHQKTFRIVALIQSSGDSNVGCE